jgi:hypothetical protein
VYFAGVLAVFSVHEKREATVFTLPGLRGGENETPDFLNREKGIKCAEIVPIDD